MEVAGGHHELGGHVQGAVGAVGAGLLAELLMDTAVDSRKVDHIESHTHRVRSALRAYLGGLHQLRLSHLQDGGRDAELARAPIQADLQPLPRTWGTHEARCNRISRGPLIGAGRARVSYVPLRLTVLISTLLTGDVMHQQEQKQEGHVRKTHHVTGRIAACCSADSREGRERDASAEKSSARLTNSTAC